MPNWPVPARNLRNAWVWSIMTITIHTCDRSKLPAGTVILKVMKPKVVRTVVNLIEEHHFEVLKVKYPDGSISQVYLPCDADALSHLYDEVVPGTHITSSLLSYLLFNRYLANWADKGALQLNKLNPALKSILRRNTTMLIRIK